MQKKMHRKLWMSRETIHFSWQSHHSHYRTENDRLLKVTHCFCFYFKMCQLIWSYLQSKRFIWHQSLYWANLFNSWACCQEKPSELAQYTNLESTLFHILETIFEQCHSFKNISLMKLLYKSRGFQKCIKNAVTF